MRAGAAKRTLAAAASRPATLSQAREATELISADRTYCPFYLAGGGTRNRNARGVVTTIPRDLPDSMAKSRQSWRDDKKGNWNCFLSRTDDQLWTIVPRLRTLASVDHFTDGSWRRKCLPAAGGKLLAIYGWVADRSYRLRGADAKGSPNLRKGAHACHGRSTWHGHGTRR